MSRWKELPGSLDPRVRQLAVQMRRIKDHSGLGLEALAGRTGYSRASWDRYLNGRAIPPRQAVKALARACDIDPDRLLALHEVALAADAGGEVRADPVGETEAGPEAGSDAGADSGPDSGPDDQGRVRGRGRRMRGAVLAAVVVVAAVTVLLVTAPWDGGRERTGGRPAPADAMASAAPTGTPTGAFVYRAGKDYPCTVHRAGDGLLYAGYSGTRAGLIGMGSTQWPVVEAQCLLRHHGLSPGIADGNFGARTEHAVEQLQGRAHLRVDGIVGEDTWGVLRK
ncbi:helix-turn-helix domain-containing protein [Streptomyces alanosinicus]|uniref:HTH cro/C1-type domain-containing protein n=1 Tax=Streptomyces alanosinicus TaxID=68171 RepID=A0A919D074_9ACTN|nr:helix-turn-helix domain-containing protein [Streptomyces alanosinicus]GHD99237.1 hypothetical protein GCM10010339_09740 [Streptomyces alanosinicus]